MNTLLQILICILCLFFVWRIYKVIQANPEMLNKQNISKSFTTMGVLALVLIGAVVLMIMLVKH